MLCTVSVFKVTLTTFLSVCLSFFLSLTILPDGFPAATPELIWPHICVHLPYSFFPFSLISSLMTYLFTLCALWFFSFSYYYLCFSLCSGDELCFCLALTSPVFYSFSSFMLSVLSMSRPYFLHLSVLARRFVSLLYVCVFVSSCSGVCGCMSPWLPGRLDSPFLRQQHSPSSPSSTPPLRGASPLRTPPQSRTQPTAAAGRYSA